MDPTEPQLPEELEPIAARLQAERAQASRLKLDQIKQRVIARCSTTQGKSTFMKSRLAAIATLVALVGGTSGAIAVGSNSNGNGFRASAASSQYCDNPSGAFDLGFNRGFNAGFNPGFNAGFNPGFHAGFNSGFNRGFNVGFGVGSRTGEFAGDVGAASAAPPPPNFPACNQFFDQGFNSGYHIGFNHGFNIGFNRGFHIGYNRGFNIGFNRGFHAGRIHRDHLERCDFPFVNGYPNPRCARDVGSSRHRH